MLSEALAASPLLSPESGTLPNPGGVFPAARVKQDHLRGRDILAHGTREMLV
jgi:hypothetical protein